VARLQYVAAEGTLGLALGRDDVAPGMIAAIQTHGELLHWNPHVHMLLTCGAFTPQGEFLELPELHRERLEAAWQEAVFALYLPHGGRDC